MYIHIIYTIILYMIYANRLTTCLFAGYLRLSIIMCVFMSLFVPRNCEHVLKLPSEMCWKTMAILPILQNWLNKIHDDQTCKEKHLPLPIGSMYGIYANIGGILMVNVTIYIAYMDPMGYEDFTTLFSWYFSMSHLFASGRLIAVSKNVFHDAKFARWILQPFRHGWGHGRVKRRGRVSPKNMS